MDQPNNPRENLSGDMPISGQQLLKPQRSSVSRLLILLVVIIVLGGFSYLLIKKSSQRNPEVSAGVSINTIEIEKLPSGVSEKILFSHFNFDTKETELYMADSQGGKLLTRHKIPSDYTHRYFLEVSPDEKKIVYKISSGTDYDSSYSQRIHYQDPDSEGVFYTPNSSLFIANADGSKEKVLVAVEGKQDIPRFIWSPDGRYIFYNLVDYSTQGDADDFGSQIKVGVWQIDTELGEKTLLYEGFAKNWDIFDYYLIGYEQKGQSLLVPRIVRRGEFNDITTWEIAKIKTAENGAKINSRENITTYVSVARGEPGLFDRVILMGNGNILYSLAGDFGLIGPDGVGGGPYVTILRHDVMTVKKLNNDLVLISGSENRIQFKDVYNGAGEKVDLKIFANDSFPSNFDMLVSVLPRSNYWLGNYIGKKDDREFNEFGLFVSLPDSNQAIPITKDNAQFVGLIK